MQDSSFNNQTSSCFGRSDKNHKTFWQNSESRVQDLKRIQKNIRSRIPNYYSQGLTTCVLHVWRS